jgi:hypothetical protein
MPSDAVIENSSDPKLTQSSIIADWKFETSEQKSGYLLLAVGQPTASTRLQTENFQ